MNGSRELMRRRLLEEMYDRMTPEEQRIFVQLAMEDCSDGEILQALQSQSLEIDEIHKQVASHTWLRDFSSNVAGNATWDAFVWIGSRLLGKL